MINWDHYRSLFPVTENHVYFMTAGAGPIPTPVLNAIHDRYTQLSLHGGGAFQENLEIAERCRNKIAQLINAESEQIAFIPNVSFGMNALSSAMIHKPEFIIPEEDFPSSIVPWKNADYNLQFVSSTPDLQENMQNALTGNKKSVITSSVQYSTGYRIDVEAVKKRMAEDSHLIVNATQSIGAFPIDVRGSKIDALICACHKWLFCGEGLAFMYIKPEFFKQLRPTIVGWRSSPFAMQFNEEFHYYDSARVFEIGWANMTIFAGLEKALDIILEIGIENVRQRVSQLMAHLLKGIVNLKLPLLSTQAVEHQSGIVLLGPFSDLDDVLAKLFEKNIYVTKRGNGIRLALHFYNNEQDIDQFLAAMDEIMHHQLPLAVNF